MSPPLSRSAERSPRTPLPSLPARPRVAALPPLRGSHLKPAPDDEHPALNRKPDHEWVSFTSRLTLSKKVILEKNPKSEVADGKEGLGAQTDGLSLPLPAVLPPTGRLPSIRSLFSRPPAQLTHRPALNSTPKAMSFPLSYARRRPRVAPESSPEANTTSAETDWHERESVKDFGLDFERAVNDLKDHHLARLPSFDEFLAAPSSVAVSATAPVSGWAAARKENKEDTGSVTPPPRRQSRAQRRPHHPLPTLRDRAPTPRADWKAIMAVGNLIQPTTPDSAPLQAQKGAPAPSPTFPAAAAPAPEPTVASTPSASPPAPALLKKPHRETQNRKTQNAKARAKALDGEQGEPNPNGLCEGCRKSSANKADCRTPKDRTTGTRCNNCTRKKVACRQPEPRPTQPQPSQPQMDEYDSDDTIVVEDEDEVMEGAA